MVQAEQRMLVMKRMRRSNINHIHIRVGNQFLITAMHMRSRKILCKTDRVPQLARTDGGEFSIFNKGQIGGEFPCYPATSQNTPSNDFHPCIFLQYKCFGNNDSW